jgi:hypothetical protein
MLLLKDVVPTLTHEHNLSNAFFRSVSWEQREDGLAVIVQLTEVSDQYLPETGFVIHEKAQEISFYAVGQLVLRISDSGHKLLQPRNGEPVKIHSLGE